MPQTHPTKEKLSFSLVVHRGELPVPVLALLAMVNGVEQVRARAGHARVTHRPVVRNGHLLAGRHRKEQIADRCVGRLSVTLQ